MGTPSCSTIHQATLGHDAFRLHRPHCTSHRRSGQLWSSPRFLFHVKYDFSEVLALSVTGGRRAKYGGVDPPIAKLPHPCRHGPPDTLADTACLRGKLLPDTRW